MIRPGQSALATRLIGRDDLFTVETTVFQGCRVMKAAVSKLISLCLAVFFLSTATATAQGTWAVTLTSKQAKELKELKSSKAHTAMAVSPDGPWGTRWGARSADAAGAEALGNCRAFLKKGLRDCVLYSVNGRVVADSVVKTRKVSAVYKPVDGKAAPGIFGRANVNFVGNVQAAEADMTALLANPAHRSNLRRDPTLEGMLRGRSFMNTKKRGFAIWFEKGRGAQYSASNNGTLKMYFGDWLATRDGLVCMFDSVWDSGKAVGTRCLVIHQINKGAADFSWPGSGHGTTTVRKGQIIAGDARRGAVR